MGDVLDMPERPRVLGWEAIAAELEDVQWVNEGLNLAPGRPFVFCGEAGTKKSWWAQSMLMCAAAGVPVIGKFPWRSGGLRCLFIDYEQGERESRARFQTLAEGMNLTNARLSGRLAYSFQPIDTWNPKRHERKRVVAELIELVNGYDVVVVDSLLDCQPGVDENTSEIAAALKISTRVSELTRPKVLFGFTDHSSGKSSDGKRGNAQRGHTAKKGASSVLFVATENPNGSIRVTCERSQNASPSQRPKPFTYDLQPSLRGHAIVGVPEPEQPDSESKNIVAEVLECVKQNPERSATWITKELKRGKERVLASLQSLEASRHVFKHADGSYVPISHP